MSIFIELECSKTKRNDADLVAYTLRKCGGALSATCSKVTRADGVDVYRICDDEGYRAHERALVARRQDANSAKSARHRHEKIHP